MAKILITGFDPFGGEKINPAYEAVKAIKDNINGVEVVKMEVPTVFYDSIEKVTKKIKEIDPIAVLLIGQAGGRFGMTVERVAINVDDARIKDNKGQQPIDKPIDPEGQPAYFSTIPVKKIVEKMKENKIPASVSNTAGTFVCNHLLYGTLNYIHKNNKNIKAGFIHVPFLPEQVIDKPNTPSMSVETIVKALETAVEVITSTQKTIITQA